MAAGSNGMAYLTGGTLSSNFPTKNGFQLINASAGQANGYDAAGRTGSTNFPQKQAWQGPRGNADIFLARVRPAATGAASLVYSTYLGGTGDDYGYGVAAGPASTASVTGWTAGPTAGTIPANVIGPNGTSTGVLAIKGSLNITRVYLPMLRR